VRSKILVALVAVAVMGVSSAAMARGGGKSGGGMHGHGHFVHNQFRDRFGRNPFFFGDGFDWGFGGPYYGEGNGSNTTVVVFPQAPPKRQTSLVQLTLRPVIGMKRRSKSRPQPADPSQSRS
jgi:opacity protein-like surface antigen